MRRSGKTASLFLLVLLAVALTLWMGPRPVYDPWVAEELSPQDCSRLLPAAVLCTAPLGARQEAQRREETARANGIDPGRLLALGISLSSPGAQLFDADNDGDLDLFIPRGSRSLQGMPIRTGRVGAAGDSPAAFDPKERPEHERFCFYLNEGAGPIREVGGLLGPAFTTVRDVGDTDPLSGCIDLDHDGRLELVVALRGGGRLVLWNRLARRSFLRVAVHPSGPPSSLSRIARVEVSNSSELQVRLVDLAGSLGSEASGWRASLKRIAYFGLGDVRRVEKLTVVWPSGRKTELRDLEVDQQHEIAEPLELDAGDASPAARGVNPTYQKEET